MTPAYFQRLNMTYDEALSNIAFNVKLRRYPKAVKQYTMAIRMDKTSFVLFSNRSGAYCGCGKYEEALADAERQGTLHYCDTPPPLPPAARPP